jgi:hypothetical protein
MKTRTDRLFQQCNALMRKCEEIEDKITTLSLEVTETLDAAGIGESYELLRGCLWGYSSKDRPARDEYNSARDNFRAAVLALTDVKQRNRVMDLAVRYDKMNTERYDAAQSYANSNLELTESRWKIPEDRNNLGIGLITVSVLAVGGYYAVGVIVPLWLITVLIVIHHEEMWRIQGYSERKERAVTAAKEEKELADQRYLDMLNKRRLFLPEEQVTE